MNSKRLLLKRRWQAALDRYGVAVEHYPHYVNTTPLLHSIDALLVSFIVRGKGEHVIGKTVFRELEGSVGITYYGEKHTIVTDAEGMEIYNIFLDPESSTLPILPSGLNDTLHLIFPQHHGFRNQLNRTIHLQLPEAQSLASVAALMAREMKDSCVGSEEVVADCLRVFLIACCRAAQESGIQPSYLAGTPHWVQRLCRSMDRRFAEALSLSQIAASVGMNPGYVCHAFKRYTGKTVFAYLIERRVQAAMLRLRSTDEKVLSIALACGFRDLSHFNRTFRSLVGCAPTVWRRGKLVADPI